MAVHSGCISWAWSRRRSSISVAWNDLSVTATRTPHAAHGNSVTRTGRETQSEPIAGLESARKARLRSLALLVVAVAQRASCRRRWPRYRRGDGGILGDRDARGERQS